jgi:hypothetical protein
LGLAMGTGDVDHFLLLMICAPTHCASFAPDSQACSNAGIGRKARANRLPEALFLALRYTAVS